MIYCKPLPLCKGHIAKFDNCLAKALYELGVDYADADCGNAIDWHGYMMLFLFDEPFTVKADQWSGEFDLNIAAHTYVTVFTNDQRKVTLVGYETRDEAMEAWERFNCAYEEWLGDGDDE